MMKYMNYYFLIAVLELRIVMIAFVSHSLYFLFYLVITTLDLAKTNVYKHIYVCIYIH